ncbi:MAG: ATP-binding protein [Acidobacteriota bacterium]|nr:ATP-binding protein [Acidobacteriota bacterium]
MLGFLIRDAWFRLILAVWAALIIFYLAPGVPTSAREYFGDYLLSLTFLPLPIITCIAGVWRIERKTERRFWQVLGAAFTIWLLYALPYFWIPDDQWTLTASVAGDCAYLGFYLLTFLAIELKPHLQTMDRLEGRERRLRSIGLTILLFGWLCYLVVIPASLEAVEYESELPSFLLYISLDSVLVARLLWVRRESWSVRWATIYGMLAAAMTVMLAGDLLETLYVADVIPLGSGSPLDLLWTAPFVLVAATARARHAAFDPGQGVLNQDWRGRGAVRVGVLLMAGAIVLPIVHHALYALRLLDPRIERYRDVVVESTLVALATLAILAFRVLESERLRVEEREQVLRKELDQARKMDAVARVAGAVAHDFNNLLHVIRGRVELAAENIGPAHPAHEDLREIRSAATRASAMASDLLTFGRREPVASEAVRLHTFIDGMRRQLKLVAGESTTLTIALRAEKDTVSIDGIKFERVMLNLVGNSRNAMPVSGRIEVETWNPDTPAGTPPQIAIAVRDSGQGMSADVLDKAFEPFFTTRREAGGSGMGLSSAHGIVQAMGGSIRAESEVGQGTSIVITLPVEQGAVDMTAANRPQGALLIVETDPHMRQMLRGYFADIWKPVLTSGNAMEALQIAGTAGQTISILITDTAPSGLTYETLIARLRALHPALRVVLIVPEDFTGTPVDCLVVREPLSLESLADELKTLID